MNFDKISKEEILKSLGLEPRRSTAGLAFTALGVFGAGLIVGAGVGMLLAPKAGSELRSDIRDRMRRHREEVEEIPTTH